MLLSQTLTSRGSHIESLVKFRQSLIGDSVTDERTGRRADGRTDRRTEAFKYPHPLSVGIMTNPDDSFTESDSISFLSPKNILLTAQENKYLGIC